eukprot:1156321-Pelagomonas_calceolata.AAC.1
MARDADAELRKQRSSMMERDAGTPSEVFNPFDKDRERCRRKVHVFSSATFLKRRQRRQVQRLEHKGKLLTMFKGQSSKVKAPSLPRLLLSAKEKNSAKKKARHSHICEEDTADNLKLVNLIKECHEVVLQVCTTKKTSTNSKHFKIRRVSFLRKSLCNKLKSVRHMQYNLPQAHLTLTFEEALA